jgi:hypothetical protein
MEWVIVRPVALLDKPAKGRYTAGPLARVAVLVNSGSSNTYSAITTATTPTTTTTAMPT